MGKTDTQQNEAGAQGRCIQHLRKKKNQSKPFCQVLLCARDYTSILHNIMHPQNNPIR